MASFVESATLLLKDDASKKIDSVNKSLKKLFATANKMKNMRIKLNVDQASISKTERLTKAVTALTKASAAARAKTIGPKIDATSISKANQLALAVQKLNRATGARPGRAITSPVSASAVRNVRGLTTSLKELDRIMARKRGAGVLPIPTVDATKLAGIRNATAALLKYARALKALPGGGGRLPIPGGSGLAPPPGGGRTRIGGGFFGGNPRVGGGGAGNLMSLFAAVARVRSAYILQAQAMRAVTAGFKAIGDQSSELTAQRNLGIPETGTNKQFDVSMQDLARNADTLGERFLNLTKTEIMATERNALLAGAQKKSLTEITGAMLQAQSAMTSMFGPDEAARITQDITKSVDLAGLLDDAIRGPALIKALAGAQLAAGKDLNFKSILAGFRSSGMAQTAGPGAIVEFASNVDEFGQRAGTMISRLDKLMTAQGAAPGVAKGQLEKLIASGVRTKAGPVNPELFATDKFAWVRAVVEPLLRKQPALRGLDLESGLKASDIAKVKKGLQDLGFTSKELELVLSTITKAGERERARQQAAVAGGGDQEALARKDITQGLLDVGTQWKNIFGSMTDFVNRNFASATVDIAQSMREFATSMQGGTPLDILKAFFKNAPGLITGGAVGLGALAVANPGVTALIGAGTALTGSAAALTAAAARLALAGGVGGVGGAAGGAAAGAGAGLFTRLLRTGAVLGIAAGAIELLKKSVEVDNNRKGGGLVGVLRDMSNEVTKIRADRETTKAAVAKLAPTNLGAGRPTGPIIASNQATIDRLQKVVSDIMEQEKAVARTQLLGVGAGRPGVISDNTLLAADANVGLRDLMTASQGAAAAITQLTVASKSTMGAGATPGGMDPGIAARSPGAMVLEPAATAAARVLNEGTQGAVSLMIAGMDKNVSSIQTAFGIGANDIGVAGTTAASSMSSGITTGGQSAGASIAAQMIAAATQVGSTIAAAVRNATANVTVRVQNPGGGGPPANVGAHVGGGL